ncbi:SGNH/GDSL hydrolase family protein [Alicyclobacillus fastidiosus]|uniref:SGNH/GDSL hydrolase family protein n=1 Tax=Alicyclobacillus fastidiosus TaxID=392011 RepID=A0ABV5AKL6_9BACL|nr:SGNH/GDSL hydrolase family protein [Alicyclobacillus fastidiosus]WEH08324.1 SGNH/GDSL hydrolase family protein [Alicyclobacillus fastidiosus]
MRKLRQYVASALALSLLGLMSGCGTPGNQVGTADSNVSAPSVKVSSNKTSASKPNSKVQLSHLTVMGIGGSIALGDQATNDNGYLQRTFAHFHDTYVNKAIYGANSTQLATMYKNDYTNWLSTVHPHVVVISWGLLNDVLPNTPMSKFNEYLNQEIKDALAIHAMVFVVTPPATEFAYTYEKREDMYAQDEMQLVRKMNNPNVYAFDLLSQMKSYIASHNLKIADLSGDAHHPNDQGHQLAAQILIQDLSAHFR